MALKHDDLQEKIKPGRRQRASKPSFSSENGQDKPALRGRGLSVLLVDSKEGNSQFDMFSEIAMKTGHSATRLKTFHDAVEAVHKGGVDIIVTELKLPDGDGIELARNAMEYDKRISVAIATIWATVESAVRAMKIGIWDYCTIPMRISEIESMFKGLEESHEKKKLKDPSETPK